MTAAMYSVRDGTKTVIEPFDPPLPIDPTEVVTIKGLQDHLDVTVCGLLGSASDARGTSAAELAGP